MGIERGRGGEGRNNHHHQVEFCDARRRCEFSHFMIHYKRKSGRSPLLMYVSVQPFTSFCRMQ